MTIKQALSMKAERRQPVLMHDAAWRLIQQRCVAHDGLCDAILALDRAVSSQSDVLTPDDVRALQEAREAVNRVRIHHKERINAR